MRPDNYTQTSNHSFAHLSELSLKESNVDRYFNIRISRNTLLAVVFSLLLHALIFFAVPQIKFDTPPSATASTIQVSLAPFKIPTQVIEPIQAPQQPSVEPAMQNKPPVHAIATPKIMTQKPLQNKKSSFVVPVAPEPKVKAELDKRPPSKESEVKELPVEQQYTDMAAYVKARQAKRLDSETVAAQINAEAVARERGLTEAQLRDQRIQQNLKSGTNGIFEITSLGQRNATFAFRGWTNDYSASKRQFTR